MSTTWTIRTSAADNQWKSIAWNGTVFAAVANSGTGNRVMTSTDGITWTSRTSPADNWWLAIAWNGTVFAAVGDSGSGNRAMTSPDGITWTIRTSAADNAWHAIAWNGTVFAAVAYGGTGNRVMTSPDGITWTIRTSATSYEWMGIAWNGTVFAAVAQTGTGNRVMTSPDGITWTSRTSAVDNEWRGIAWNGTVFAAVAKSGTGNRVMTSPDGITWTSRTSAADNEWHAIAWNGTVFAAVSSTGTGNRVMTSPDGISWTIGTSAANNEWRAIASDGIVFAAVSDSGTGNRVMTSDVAPASSTGLPTLIVEVAFADNGLTTLPTWVNITPYVRGGSIKSGRTSELDEFQAGSCSLTLDNRTRRFDPFYTAGPYYEKLKARRQCRIRATYGATTYDLFRGHVSGWALSPDLSGDSVCQIEGYDGLAYLAKVDLPVDFYTWTVENLTDQPVAWWPLGASDVNCTDRKDAYSWTFTTATPSVGSTPSQWMAGSGTQFASDFAALGPIVPPHASTTAWTVEGFVKTATAGGATPGFVNPILCNAGPDNATIGVDDSGRLVFRNGTGNDINSGLPINDDRWHHFAILYNGSGGPAEIFVDGVYLTFGTLTGTGACGTGWQLLGSSNHAGDSPLFTGELAHVKVYQVSVNSIDVAKLAAAGLRGTVHNGTRSDQWVQQVLTAAGWPAGLTVLEAGTVKPGGMRWGQNALTVLQLLAKTEGGRIFVDSSGTVRFYNRSHDLTAARATTSQAIYSDSGLAAVVPFNSVGEISYSDVQLANRVLVTTAEGLAFTVNDTGSQTTYGIVATQIDTALDSQADALTYGSIYLDTYKSPSLRIDGWRVQPQAKGSISFPLVLDARLADRVTFEILPNSVGTRISQPLIVEQIAHDFSPDSWVTSFSGSPAVVAWILEDTTYGLLESTTRLG